MNQLAASTNVFQQAHNWPLWPQIGLILGLAAIGLILNRISGEEDGSCLAWIFEVAAIVFALNLFF